MMRVKFISGGYIGMTEEYFITRLKPGDKFVLAGRVLELVRINEMTALVRASSGKAFIPSWLGGRLPLSANLSHFLRQKMDLSRMGTSHEPELRFLHPLLSLQKNISRIPAHTKEGYHLFMYPFEGRQIHEVMATLIAYRISRLYQISFTMAMNDYGFELFSDVAIHLNDEQLQEILSPTQLMQDVIASINATEMASRKFRDIAVISGMVIQNFPGTQKNNKSLQASAGLLFKVLEEHDPDNLLIRQAYAEVFNQQLEEPRLIAAFERIRSSKVKLIFANEFTPLSFPIKIDSLRQSLSSEDLALRIQRLKTKSRKPNNKK